MKSSIRPLLMTTLVSTVLAGTPPPIPSLEDSTRALAGRILSGQFNLGDHTDLSNERGWAVSLDFIHSGQRYIVETALPKPGVVAQGFLDIQTRGPRGTYGVSLEFGRTPHLYPNSDNTPASPEGALREGLNVVEAYLKSLQ
jgi:hypothetical protein